MVFGTVVKIDLSQGQAAVTRRHEQVSIYHKACLFEAGQDQLSEQGILKNTAGEGELVDTGFLPHS